MRPPAGGASRPQLCRTDELDHGTRMAARALLVGASGARSSERDWGPCLGGVHAVLWGEGGLVGHGAVIRRQFRLAGRAVRVGYVEGLAVRADQRGRGVGGRLMTALEDVVVRGGFEMGALSATAEAAGFYEARGWWRWQGPSSAFGPSGIEYTPEDDGAIFVLPLPAAGLIDVDGALTCDWRDGELW